jgi:cephalosporin hydroxylase
VIEPLIDVEASLRVFTDGPWPIPGSDMLKTRGDLDRYEQLIEATRPDVVVECGTWSGESALWFAAQGVDVVTVDVARSLVWPGRRWDAYSIWAAIGDSADPGVASGVRMMLAGARTMVVLDSDHSAAHVAREIELYGPLVTPGCYLVVEDGIIRHMPDGLREQHVPGLVGDPLDAIEEKLVGNPDWVRDTEVEAMFPVSHHPAGWWRRAAS